MYEKASTGRSTPLRPTMPLYSHGGHHIESGGCEVLVERQGFGNTTRLHHRKANRVGEREILITELSKPVGNRALLGVGSAADHEHGRFVHSAGKGQPDGAPYTME